jgi:hypothetical protein
MVMLVDTVKRRAVALDDAIPTRSMEEVLFEDVCELPPPIPDRVALLRVTPINSHVVDVGINKGGGIYWVCEIE